MWLLLSSLRAYTEREKVHRVSHGGTTTTRGEEEEEEEEGRGLCVVRMCVYTIRRILRNRQQLYYRMSEKKYLKTILILLEFARCIQIC